MIASLFSHPPFGWGLRGDPYLWDTLQADFTDTPLPGSDAELLEIINQAIIRHFGRPLESRDTVYVEKLAHGVMSSGQVSLDYWRKSLIPFLLHRARIKAVTNKARPASVLSKPGLMTILCCALSEAQSKLAKIDDPDKGRLHRRRSREFVEQLAASFLAAYPASRAIAALSKHHDDERKRFGMNELLYDVSVVEYGDISSGNSRKTLTYVKQALWLVESEMARNTREALYDFNKLVMGSGDDLLFVGPHVRDQESYLKILGAAAQHCRGRIHVALIPHPDEWYTKAWTTVSLWEWQGHSWNQAYI